MKRLRKKLNGDLSMPSEALNGHNCEKCYGHNTRFKMGYFEAMSFIK
ncbi:MAG TPA: hypothetical protein VGA80_10660 [Flavobacteriaceae bacterium]